MKFCKNCMKFQEEFDGNHLGGQKEVKNQFFEKTPSLLSPNGGWIKVIIEMRDQNFEKKQSFLLMGHLVVPRWGEKTIGHTDFFS